MRLAQLKPKEEVYLQSQFATKTRNIMVVSSFAQMPAHILMKSVHHNSPNYIDDDHAGVILGFTAFKGGMDAFIRQLWKKVAKTGMTTAVYADNLHILQLDPDTGTYLYASLDGAKMEATITPSDVHFHMRRIIDLHMGFYKSTPRGWINYALQVLPTLDADAIGLFSNQQFPIPGLPSGVVGTAYFNTAKMCGVQHGAKILNIKALELVGDQVVLTKEFTQLCADVGVVLQVESFILQAQQSLAIQPKNPNIVQPVDVLGFNVVYYVDLNISMWLPVLNYGRILKALIFNKRHRNARGESTLSVAESALLQLIKITALYYLGGWYYTPLDNELALMAHTSHAQLVRQLGEENFAALKLDASVVSSAVSDALGGFAELGMDNASVQSIILEVLERPLPTVYSVFRLLIDHDAALEYVRLTLKDRPLIPVRYVAPPRVLARFDVVVPEVGPTGVSTAEPPVVRLLSTDEMPPREPFHTPEQATMAAVEPLGVPSKARTRVPVADVARGVIPSSLVTHPRADPEVVADAYARFLATLPVGGYAYYIVPPIPTARRGTTIPTEDVQKISFGLAAEALAIEYSIRTADARATLAKVTDDHPLHYTFSLYRLTSELIAKEPKNYVVARDARMFLDIASDADKVSKRRTKKRGLMTLVVLNDTTLVHKLQYHQGALLNRAVDSEWYTDDPKRVPRYEELLLEHARQWDLLESERKK
jgi:hypothetical protein